MKKIKIRTFDKPGDPKLADQMLARNELRAKIEAEKQDRVERCGKALSELLQKERCQLTVPFLALVDGKTVPQIQLQALD